MKSTFRSIILVALIAFLAVVPGFNAHAQDNCFGLKADDCALANGASSSANMAKLTSFVNGLHDHCQADGHR